MAGGPLELWNHWSIQIVVLLSLVIQFVLFFFAGIRRREALPWLRPLLWQAYQQADSTVIYALGHLSLSSATREHQLVAFWAPFLLLHLGGPDSISAYALEDNQLWLRHLQKLVVQVLGAAYVLVKHVARNGSLVKLAAYLMFAVGVVKYGERTWALRCSKMDNIRSSVKEPGAKHTRSNMDNIRNSLKEPRAKHHHFYPLDQGRIGEEATDKEEFHLRRAHSLFHICKRAIVDSWLEKDPESEDTEMLRALRKEGYEGMWITMEMELSLLYDILYTKAAVIHTWHGYLIRVVSPLATAASLLLFKFSGKDGHRRVDVGVTYALLVGAFLLETTSLLKALGSTWTYSYLCATPRSWLRYEALCTGRWDHLRRLVKTILRGWARRWSGEIGQHNMLHSCVRRKTAFSPLLGLLAKMMGRKEYSGTTEISDELKERLFEYIAHLPWADKVNSQGVLRKKWGQVPLEDKDKWGQVPLEHPDKKPYEDLEYYLGVELQEGIITLHLGTEVFLVQSSGAEADGAAHLVKCIRTLSNYMMFLLVDRPDMLPGLAQNKLYRRTCENLDNVWCKGVHSSPNRLKELFRLRDGPNLSGDKQTYELATMLSKETREYTPDVPRLGYANTVADKLLEYEKEIDSMAVLELLRDVWLDFLVYTGNHCSRESHAKKLSSGGELTTVLWLMMDYLHQEYLNRTDNPNY